MRSTLPSDNLNNSPKGSAIPVSLFLEQARQRAALATEHARFLASQANLLIATGKQINRANFKERAFNRLPSKLASIHFKLHASIIDEGLRQRSPRERLDEAIFLERLLAPPKKLADL